MAALLEAATWLATLYTIAGGAEVGGRYLYPGIVWAAVWILVAGFGRRRWRDLSLVRGLRWVARADHDKVVLAAMATWCAIIGAAQVLPLLALGVGPYELGIFDQAVSSIVREGEPYTSLRLCRSVLGEHFQPIVYAFAPLYLIHEGPTTLLVAQTLVAASGAWPLYRLAQARLGRSTLTLALTGAFLAFAPMRNASTFNFHPEAASTALILWIFWARDRQRWTLVLIGAVAMLTIKEHVPLVVAAIGVMFAWRDRKQAFGFGLALIGLIWFYLAVSTWIPEAAGRAQMHHLSSRYGHLGSTPSEVITYVLSHPWVPVGLALTKIEYLVKLLGPLVLLPLVRPFWLIGALPTYALNVLSSYRNQTSISFQYTAEITPFVFLAALDGIAAIRARTGDRRLIAALLCAATLFVEIPESRKIRRAVGALPRGTAITERLAVIDDAAPVSATPAVLTHLAGRRGAYMFPELGDAEWVVVERSGLRYRWHGGAEVEAATLAVLPALGFEQIEADEALEIWRRPPGVFPFPTPPGHCPGQPADPLVGR